VPPTSSDSDDDPRPLGPGEILEWYYTGRTCRCGAAIVRIPGGRALCLGLHRIMEGPDDYQWRGLEP